MNRRDERDNLHSPASIVVKFEEINLKFKKVQDPQSITTVIERHSVSSTL